MPAPDAVQTKARIKDVEMIMVRDGDLMAISDDEQIWSQLSTADVDFYVDMSHIYGSTSQQISGLGSGTIDNFGAGYDVQTSAKVNSFGNDTVLLFTMMEIMKILLIHPNKLIPVHRQWELTSGNTTNGSTWALKLQQIPMEVVALFFIVVEAKK